MKIIPYDPNLHSAELALILLNRGLLASRIYELPKFGLVAVEHGAVVACGFLRQVEGKTCIMDSYLSNPIWPGSIRNRALDLITEKLLKIATSNNYQVICFSKDHSILERAVRHGFELVEGQRLLSKLK